MKARPTILGLMGVIAYIAVGMAALRTNDELWADVVFALTVFALVGTVVAIYRRGAWAGFAVFGWAQFLICQPNTAPALGPTSLSMGIAYRLLPYVTTAIRFPPPTFRIAGYPAIMADGDGKPFLAAVSGGSAGSLGYVPLHSLRTGLCLSSLIIVLLRRRRWPRRPPLLRRRLARRADGALVLHLDGRPPGEIEGDRSASPTATTSVPSASSLRRRSVLSVRGVGRRGFRRRRGA